MMPNKQIYQKRGQITVFIIAGILIVVIASLMFFLARNVNSSQRETNAINLADKFETDSIKMFIQGCVDNSAKQSIVLLSQQGGSIAKPTNFIEFEDFFIAYDYYEGQNLLPTKAQIEEDIAKYVSENILKCVDEGKKYFSSELELGEIKTVAKIDDEDVSFDVDYTITIKYLEKVEKLDPFKTKVDVRLSYVLDVVDSIIRQEVDNPLWFNISNLNQIDFNIKILPHGESEIIYLLIDNESKIDNNAYIFVFANKFKENLPPTIVPISPKETKAGKEIVFYVYAVDPEGDEITYSGIDARILNEKTGAVRFMSSIAGTYNFQIKATDTDGNYDEKQLSIKVIQ